MPEQLRSKLIGLLVLVGVTLAIYWPATHFDFINYDDPEYLLLNPGIQHGLNRESMTWALESTDASNWHPLTWISHTVDWSLYGNHPRGPHLTNLLFHAGNTALLFLLLTRLTGNAWRSALVAALFAWHPLHVESVAWISERKDVLSTFFMLLTLLAYGGYARATSALEWSEKEKSAAANPNGSLSRGLPLSNPRIYFFYFLSLVLFALGLMAKPMLVTLPFLLLLLDYWPLKRFFRFRDWNFILCALEKIPFLSLSFLDGQVTVLAQQGSNSVANAATLPFPVRLANALVSYVRYLGKTAWPAKLVVPYPYDEWNFRHTAAAAMLLLGISGFVLWRRKSQPFLAVGWFWFVISLLPVIGLMQVGSQAMADRYTYIPLIGIFMMLAWAIPGSWFVWPRPGLVAGAVLAGVLAFLVMATELQLQYWRNSISLFGHTVSLTSGSLLAEYNLAEALARSGNPDAAALHYQKALAIIPNRLEARQYDSKPFIHFNLGLIFRARKQWPEAEAQFRDYVKAEPRLAAGHANLGVCLLAQGQDEAGTAELEKCLRLNSPVVHDAELTAMQENAYAEAGAPDKALAAAMRFRALAYAQGDTQAVEAAGRRIAAYQAALTAAENKTAPEK